LTVAETAAYLQRSTEQVRRYLREGDLRGNRLGGQWFVAYEDVERFRQQREERLAMALLSTTDPLGDVIAVGGSGDGNIALGRMRYVKAMMERG
jgi:excisionase family DNA binding protein